MIINKLELFLRCIAGVLFILLVGIISLFFVFNNCPNGTLSFLLKSNLIQTKIPTQQISCNLLNSALYNNEEVKIFLLTYGKVFDRDYYAPLYTYIMVSQSGNFEIIDWELAHLSDIATDRVKKEMGAYSYLGTHMERYVTMRYITPDKRCGIFDVNLPMTGTLTACKGEKYATGTITVASDTLSYASASEKAIKVAVMLYQDQGRIKFDHTPTKTEIESLNESLNKNPEEFTYVSPSIYNWVYRTDGKYWLFYLRLFKVGIVDGYTDKFDDAVLVRADDSGSACVISKNGKRNGKNFKFDIFTSASRDFQCE